MRSSTDADRHLALETRWHPTGVVEEQPDGSERLAFRAAGLGRDASGRVASRLELEGEKQDVANPFTSPIRALPRRL